MSPEQQFHNDIIGWCLGLGFIILVLVICFVAAGVAYDHIHNPFGPLIRSLEARRKVKLEMRRLEHRALLIKNGLDADYVAHLEKKNREGRL
jgi:hypothetical protein